MRADRAAVSQLSTIDQRPILLLLIALASLLSFTASASPAYDYKIVATKNQIIGGFTLQSIKQNPTINDNSHIAFVGTFQGANDVLVRWNGTQNELLSTSGSGTFGSAAIDDSDRVATSFSATGGGNSVSTIRRYSGIGTYTTLAYAGNAQAGGSFLYPYASFLPQVAISSIGTVVFGAVGHDQLTYLVANNNSLRVSVPPFPVISDDAERVVVRPLMQSNSPILIYLASNFTTPEATIANAPDFSKTGQRPGINDEATIVAFYGESAAFGGNGIYVRTKTPAGWSVPQLVVTDPLGTVALGAANHFDSFLPDSPVSVTYAQCNLQSVFVAFMGTKDAQQGIYTVRLKLLPSGDVPYTVEAPTSVCTIGQTIAGLNGPASSLSVSDPLNKNGEIVFWVQTSGGDQAVILAARKFTGSHQYGFNSSPQEAGVPQFFGNFAPGYYQNVCMSDKCRKCTSQDPLDGRAKTSCYGCVLCSAATMLATVPGLETTTPSTLDLALRARSVYSGRAEFFDGTWDQLGEISGNRIALSDIGKPRTDTVPRMEMDINSYLDLHVCQRGERVILWMKELTIADNLPGEPTWKDNAHHAIFVLGKISGDWQVFDPGWRTAYERGSGTERPEFLSSLNAHLAGFTAKDQFRRFEVDEVRTFSFVSHVQSRLGCTAYSPVELTVTDSIGNRVGRNAPMGSDMVEIAGANYSRDYPPADDDGDGSVEGDITGVKTAHIFSPVAGTYLVEVTGTSAGSYKLQFALKGLGGASKITTFLGTTDVGVVSNYSMVFPAIGSTDLVLSQSVSANVVSVNSNVTFTISITNTGPDTATAVALVDPLPTWASFVSASASQGAVTQAYGTVTASLNDLASGSNATVIIVVSPTVARPMTNIVNLLLFEADLNPTNNTATQVVSVLGTNRPPRATNDFAATTNGSPVTIDVLANDFAQGSSALPRSRRGTDQSVARSHRSVEGDKQFAAQ